MRLLSEIRHYMGNYHLKSGVYHFYRSEFKQAIEFLEKAMADDPAKLVEGERANASSYLTLSYKGLAERHEERGEFDEALTQLGRALDLSPDYPDIHFALARVLERTEDPDGAVAAYRSAIERHPRYLEARVALAYCLLEAERFEEAAAAFEEAFAEKQARMERPFREAIAHLRGDDADRAHENLHAVFHSAPGLAAEHLSIANKAYRAGEHENALSALDRAIDLNPNYPDLHNFRGILLCELERFEEAVASFGRSVELSPGHRIPRLNLAFARLHAGDGVGAEGLLRAIVLEDPTDPIATAKLDELQEQRKSEKRALGSRPVVT